MLLPNERFYGEYYANASTVGLFELGLKASLPMNFVPPGYGHWSCHAGVRYQYFVDDNLYQLERIQRARQADARHRSGLRRSFRFLLINYKPLRLLMKIFYSTLVSLAALASSTAVSRAADKVVVGFIYVGPKDDYGYNQAHAEGCAGVQKLDWVKGVEEASVPETAAVQETMRNMINQDGAQIVFPTSFGYFDPHI